MSLWGPAAPLTGFEAGADLDVVRRTETELHRAARQAGEDSPMCRRVCQVVAACAPSSPVPGLFTLVRYALWSVLLDDRLDGPDPDSAALGALRDGVVSALDASAPDGAGVDPFLLPLTQCAAQLRQSDRHGAAAEEFASSVVDAVDAAIEHALFGEAVLSGVAAPPTMDDYLPVAARTINYRSFCFGLLAVSGGVADRADLDVIDRALTPGAAAVRLANDLRSVARDASERTLNALGLRTRAGEPVTTGLVQREIDRQMGVHDQILAELSAPTSELAAPMLIRSLRLSVGLYRSTDLR